jgi:hypothetical protein
MEKNGDWLGIISQASSPRRPYGDRPRDAVLNSAGMKVAEEEQSKEK